MDYCITYGGGIGDVIDQCFGDRPKYNFLNMLKPEDKCVVGFICHNPGCVEIFQNHPKANQLDIKCPGYCWPPGRLGLPEDHYLNGGDAPIVIYVHDGDREILDNLPEKYVVLSCSAGMNERFYPQAVVDEVVKALSPEWPLYAIGKNYWRNDRNPELTYPGPVVSLVDKLSVPGCLELVRRSKGLVCSHSAAHCMGNAYSKWQLLLYPDWLPKKYSYWAGTPGHIYSHGTFSAYKAALQSFIKRINE